MQMQLMKSTRRRLEDNKKRPNRAILWWEGDDALEKVASGNFLAKVGSNEIAVWVRQDDSSIWQ